jgi:hypothetical protein
MGMDDPGGVGRGFSSFGNNWTRGLTYPYVRISSVGLATVEVNSRRSFHLRGGESGWEEGDAMSVWFRHFWAHRAMC